MTAKDELKKVKAKMYRLLNDGRCCEKTVTRYRELICAVNGWPYNKCLTEKQENDGN